MKSKISFLFMIGLLACTLVMSSYTSVNETVAKGVSFMIKNDTSGNVRLYDGKGYYTINRGSSKRVNVDAGRKYYRGEGGKKGDFLFEVESGFAGKTIKLSNYM